MRAHFFLLFIIFNVSAFAGIPPILKIRVGEDIKNVSLTGSDLVTKSFLGNIVKTTSRSVELNCDSTRYLKSSSSEPLWAEISSPSGVIKWKGHYLAGNLQLVASDRVKGRCHLINEMKMEDYLSQVLSKEMHPNWPIEALKAQAVVARTYAYFKMTHNKYREKLGKSKSYDLENSEMHQVMGTIIDKSSKTTLASGETAGEVLINKDGDIEEAFFHSKCGGQTLTPEQVWGGSHMKGYKEVNCPFCSKHGLKNWKRTYSENYIKKLLSTSGYLEYGIKDSKNYMTLNTDTNRFSFEKSKLRRVLGRSNMPSNNYELFDENGSVTIQGKGHGHGVGMCQYGAYEMAKRGLNYKQILAFYFPLMKMKKIY